MADLTMLESRAYLEIWFRFDTTIYQSFFIDKIERYFV